MASIERDPRYLTPEELALRKDHRAARQAEQAEKHPDDVDRVDLTGWKGKIPNGPLAQALAAMSDPEHARKMRLRELEEEQADREEIALVKARNRFAAYTSTRPLDYQMASYADLNPAATSNVQVRGWWRSGAKTLVIAGPVGRGKTHSAWAICNEVAAADRDGGKLPVQVRGMSASDIREILQPADVHAARDEVASRNRAREERALFEADLLLIDDLTATRTTDWFRESVHKILDTRVSNRRRTIITMNAPGYDKVGEHMDERFGAAIVSRLRDDAVFVWLEGEDRRTGSVWNPFA